MKRARNSVVPTNAEKRRRSHNGVREERFAHLVKLAARGLARALQMRLTEHAVSYGHWTFLRILWEAEGITQRELSLRAGDLVLSAGRRPVTDAQGIQRQLFAEAIGIRLPITVPTELVST